MKEKFGQAIKTIREGNDWTLEEMAQKLGTTKQALSRYERGERGPKLSVANEFAKKLGVPLSVLVDEDDPPKLSISNPSFSFDPELVKSLEASSRESETKRQIRERQHQNVLKLQKIFESLSDEGQEYLLQQADIAKKMFGGK